MRITDGMRVTNTFITCLSLAALAAPASARSTIAIDDENGGSSRELPAFLQCVPYARDVTGIQIYGDAWTWWKQAEGRYRRGHTPRAGAVMAFKPYANSRLGHVAAVSKVVDSRTVLLRHANWSEMNGRRGQKEDNVLAVDVSPANDWSEVRIWHGPSQQLGSRHWPLFGFIYKDGKGDLNKAGRSERKRPERDDLIGDIIAGRL